VGLLPPNESVLEDIGALDAVQLFVQSALRADATFQPHDRDWKDIFHICRLVDGLPLGIELAASWVRLLSCAEIGAELARNLGVLTAPYADMPERHRSLRAVIKHSWDLLAENEQATLRALSVFRNGCERVASAQVAKADLLILSALVDKSLLHRDIDGRYTMHEVVRQFADEQLLLAQQEAQVKDRHLGYYLALAEHADREILGPAQFEWLPRMAAEQDNLRAALAWCQAQPDQLAQGLRLVGMPRARPRPNITAPTRPDLATGRTENEMVSQRVAPRARAASRNVWGTARKTSRLTDEIVGVIMIARTTPPESIP
jgi:predicted ATPase